MTVFEWRALNVGDTIQIGDAAFSVTAPAASAAEGADDDGFDVGLSCGGTIAVAVYPLDQRVLAPLGEAVRTAILQNPEKHYILAGKFGKTADQFSRTFMNLDSTFHGDVALLEQFMEIVGPDVVMQYLAVRHGYSLSHIEVGAPNKPATEPARELAGDRHPQPNT